MSSSLPSALPADPDPAALVKQDGRKQRSEASRARIVAAMLDLVQAGNTFPAAEDVAQRAGVGLRTVFRQFRDMEGLMAEMVEATRQEFTDAFTTPLIATTWPDRLRELSERLIRIYDHRLPMRRAGIARRYQSAAIAAGIQELNDATRSFLKAELPPSLYRDPLIVERMLLILSFDSWMRLRDDQNLTSRLAARIVHTTLTELMAEKP